MDIDQMIADTKDSDPVLHHILLKQYYPERAKELDRKLAEREAAAGLYSIKQRLMFGIYDALSHKHWGQRELAAKLGVSQPTVSSILNNKANPRLDTLIKVAELLDLELKILPKSSVTIGKNN